MTADDAGVVLAAIRARADAATVGPWGSYPWLVFTEPGGLSVAKVKDLRADAAFIAHAREDVPRLLAAVDAVLGMCADAKPAISVGCVCSADEWEHPIQHTSDRCGKPLGWDLDPEAVVAAITEALTRKEEARP